MSKLVEDELGRALSEHRRHTTSILGESTSVSPERPQHTQSHAHDSDTKPFRSRIMDTTSSFHSPLASPLPTQALLRDADVLQPVPSSPSALSPPPSALTPLPAPTLDVTSLPPPSSSAPAPSSVSAASSPSSDATKPLFYYFKYCVAYLACIFFGLTAWLPVNSLYSELPQFSNIQPEAQTLSSYLIAAQQIGNIIFFVFLHFCGGALFRSPLLMRAAVLAFLCLNVVVLLLAAFAWDTTAYIAGGQRSIVIYIGMMIAGFSSATSNVFFFPIVSEFPQSFTNAYSIGLGAASALAGGGALVQNAGASVLRFSVQTFFGALAGIACVSACAFAFLCWHPWAVALRNDYRADGAGEAGTAQQQVPFFPLATLLLRGVLVSGVETSNVYQDDSVLPTSRDPLYARSRVSFDADHHCDVLLPSGALLVMDRWCERTHTRAHVPDTTACHAAFARSSLSASGRAEVCDVTGDHHDARVAADGHHSGSGDDGAGATECDASVRARRSGEPWYRQSVTVPLPLPSKSSLFWHGRGYFLSICVVALMNFGLHQSFLPYACFNYRHSKRVYLWASSVLFIVDPCMRLLLSFPAVARRCCRRWVLLSAAAVVVLAECLVMILAAQSPFPWGWQHASMGVLPVFLSGLVGAGYALVSTCVFLMMYGESEPACCPVTSAHAEEGEEGEEPEAEEMREQRAVEEEDTLLVMEPSTTATTGSGSAATLASVPSSLAVAATICDLSLPSVSAVFLSQVLRSQYLHARCDGEGGEGADALRQQVRLHQALLVWARDEARRMRSAQEKTQTEKRTSEEGEESEEGAAHSRALSRARLLRVGYEDIVRYYTCAAGEAVSIRKKKKSENEGRADVKRATSYADHSVVRVSVTRAGGDDGAASDSSAGSVDSEDTGDGADVVTRSAASAISASAAAVTAAPLAATASAATLTAPATLAAVRAHSRPPSLAPSLVPSTTSSRIAAPTSPRTRPGRSERGGGRRASVTGYATAAEGEGVCYWGAREDATATPIPGAAAITAATPPLVTVPAAAEQMSHAPSVRSTYSEKTAFSGESANSGFLDRFEDTASMIQRVRRESLLAKQQQHVTEAAIPPHRLAARQRLQLLAAQPYQTVSVRRQESPSAVCGDADFYSPPTQYETATNAPTVLTSAPSLPLSLARGSVYGATEDARDTYPMPPLTSAPIARPSRSRPKRGAFHPTASADARVDRYLARKAQLRVIITPPVLLFRPHKPSSTDTDTAVTVAGEPVTVSVSRPSAEARALEDREVEAEDVRDGSEDEERREDYGEGYGAARRSSQASVWSNAPRRNSLGDLPSPEKTLSRAPELILDISPPTRLLLPPSPCASAGTEAHDAQTSDHALYGAVVRVDAVYSPTHAGYGRDADDEGSADAHHTPAPPVAAPAPADALPRVAAAPGPVTLLSPAVATAALSTRSSRRIHNASDGLRTDAAEIACDSSYVPTSAYIKTRRNSQLFSGLASTAASGNPKSLEVPRNPALSVISGLSLYGGDGEEEFAVHGREHRAAPAMTGAEEAAAAAEEVLDNGAGGGIDAWETRSCGSLDRREALGAGEFAGVLQDSSARVQFVQDAAPADHVFVETLPPHLRTCLNVVTVRVRKDEYCNGLRSMLYSSAGLAIQVGATVGAVASFVAVVVLEAIPDPWFR